jgi:CBS domain-containing protein
MSCIAIMSKAPVIIREEESVADAAAKLVSNRFTSLPVVDSHDRYVGMFGLYDLLSLLVPRVALAGDLMENLRFIDDDPEVLKDRYRDVRDRRVGEVANRNAPTLGPDSPEVEAVRLFCRNHSSVAVVDGKSGHVLGVISWRDAMRAIMGAG